MFANKLLHHSIVFLPCGYIVKKHYFNRTLMGVSMLALLALTACGTPAPKNFGGAWKPVNRFQDKPTEIPLAPTYTFYASPMDETLKTMLTRWSRDSGRSLSYQLAFDFTLYKPVSDIHTADLSAAVTELSAIYAAQGVSVTATDRAIVVEQANNGTSTATPADSTATPAKATGELETC